MICGQLWLSGNWQLYQSSGNNSWELHTNEQLVSKQIQAIVRPGDNCCGNISERTWPQETQLANSNRNDQFWYQVRIILQTCHRLVWHSDVPTPDIHGTAHPIHKACQVT
jgi:hypothetical protein